MRTLFVSVLMIFGIAATSSSAGAVVPGANGRIVFTRAVCTSTSCSWSIVTADENDSRERVVAGPFAQDAFDEHFIANWSPEGKALTFMANQGIWKVNADASGLRDLFQADPAGPGVDDGPAFTPDGTHILFTRCCPPGYGYSLWRISADGGGLNDVTSEPQVNGDGPADTTPQVSPDGKTIVFNHCFPNAPCEVATVRMNGTHFRDLTDNSQFQSEHPNWSPDGSEIVFEMDPPDGSPNIATINRDGSGFEQLTFSGPDAGSLQPAFSPDGTKVIFARFPSTGGTDLFTVHPNGAGLTQLTSTDSLELYPEWALARR